MSTNTLRAVLFSVTLVGMAWAALVQAVSAQQPAVPLADSSIRVPIVQALMGLDLSQGWRTNVWTDDDELILRATLSDVTQETKRLRTGSLVTVQARATFDASGSVNHLSVRDRRYPGVRVRAGADAATRAAALADARFPSTARTAILEVFGSPQRWWMLGASPHVDDVGFIWRQEDGAYERGIWRLRISALRVNTSVAFVIAIDPLSGRIMEVVSQE